MADIQDASFPVVDFFMRGGCHFLFSILAREPSWKKYE